MIGFDPSSFRDPSGRLFRHNGAVYRTCTPSAVGVLSQARDVGLLDALTSSGLLVPTTVVGAAAEGFAPSEVGDTLVRQPALPLVSYVYEWSFTMVRDAALVTLDALDLCLGKGFVLKDATPFNVLFEGTVPRLVDVHSIEPRIEGSLWAGYAQFCRGFLFPLLLQSHKGLDPRPALMAGLGEISASDVRRVLTWRDSLRRGVFVNVTVQGHLEDRFASRSEDVGKALHGTKYPLSAVRAQVGKLRRLIAGLATPRGDAWTTYVDTHTYDESAVRMKEAFVTQAIAETRPGVVLDLGANTGVYSRLARKAGARVVAIDSSAAVVDEIYRQSRGDTGLSPLAADLTKPTPALGWNLIERPSLLDRLRGDMVLALALVHHLRISGGIPLAEIVALLTRLAPTGIIEWVGRDDSMVRRLLALRQDVFDDYTPAQFERELEGRARIEARQDVSRDRVLYRFRTR